MPVSYSDPDISTFIVKKSRAHLLGIMRSLAYGSSLKVTNSPAMVEYWCNPDLTGTYLTEAEKNEAKAIFEEFVVEDPDASFDFAIFLFAQGYVRTVHRDHLRSPGDVNMFSTVEIYKDGKSVEQFKVVAGDTLVFDRFEQYSILGSLDGFLHYMNKNPVAKRFRCARSLRNLWGNMYLISTKINPGFYPEPNRWCEISKGVLIFNIEAFHSECSGAYDPCQDGYSINPECEQKASRYFESVPCQCKYAMNPNCKPDSPPDTVLLFESKPGWNQFGGPEILDANHHKPAGSNILFNNGSIRFIKQEDFGKLKW